MHKTNTSHNRCGGHRALRNIAIAFLISLLSAACTDSYNRSADKAMDHAETIMETAPDSALALLDSLDPSRLHGERRKALHALLITQARDKNYIDQTSDTLLLPAVEYFDSSEDQYHRMLAHYYLSRIKFYNGEIIPASHEAEEAFDLIEPNFNESEFWRARIYNDMATMAQHTSSLKLSIDYRIKAIEIFDSLKADCWEDESILELAHTYETDLQYENARNTLIAIDTAKIGQSQKKTYLNILARINAGEGNYLEAQNFIIQASSMNEIEPHVTPSDLGFIALINMKNGNSQYADTLIEKAYKSALCFQDSFKVSYYDFLATLGNPSYADIEAKYMTYRQLSHNEAQKRIDSHIAMGINKFYINKLEYQDIKSKLTLYKLIAIITSILLTGTIISLIAYRKWKYKQQEIIGLNDVNRLLRAEIKEIKDKTSNTYTDELNEILRKIIATSFAHINTISKKTYSAVHKTSVVPEKSENRLAQEFIEIMSSLNNPELFTTLEASLNANYANLMMLFRDTFPNIKENDIKLAILLFSNLGSHTICLIMGYSNLETLRNKKSRLKKSLIKYSPDKADHFISYI